MTHVRGEIVIDRPVEDVFDYVADERNEPKFNPRMISATKVSEGPVGLGTRFDAKMRSSGGRAAEMTIEYAEYQRPHRLVSLTRMAAMDIDGELTFEPIDGGTRMSWSWHLQPHGALKLIGPVIGVVGRRQEHAIWRGLKALLENRSSPVPSR